MKIFFTNSKQHNCIFEYHQFSNCASAMLHMLLYKHRLSVRSGRVCSQNKIHHDLTVL